MTMLSLELVIKGLSTQCYLYHQTSRATALFEKNLDTTVAMAETNSALRYQGESFIDTTEATAEILFSFPVSRKRSLVWLWPN